MDLQIDQWIYRKTNGSTERQLVLQKDKRIYSITNRSSERRHGCTKRLVELSIYQWFCIKADLISRKNKRLFCWIPPSSPCTDCTSPPLSHFYGLAILVSWQFGGGSIYLIITGASWPPAPFIQTDQTSYEDTQNGEDGEWSWRSGIHKTTLCIRFT